MYLDLNNNDQARKFPLNFNLTSEFKSISQPHIADIWDSKWGKWPSKGTLWPRALFPLDTEVQ